MDYLDCEDIIEFYKRTGMNRQQAFEFLMKELKKNHSHSSDNKADAQDSKSASSYASANP